MCSTLCIILSAIVLIVGLLVFAGLLLWCESFQIAKGGGAAPAATASGSQEVDSKADTEASAKAEEEAAALAAKQADTSVATDDAGTAEPDTDGDGLPDIDTATPEQAAAAFSEELKAGFARQEEDLGIIYNQRPDTVDDLKLIKGVAKILEQQLHNSGIHRFKQIALWTDKAAREFGTRLSFRDRIFRDDWIAQAKKFHEEEYGEKL
jgi:predicted flap endonuclease-1-like 5' DNA nuclease